MEKKKFDLGTILSITDGHLFTEMENVCGILNYMTGDELYTHQLPRATEECAPVILRQYPQFANIDGSNVDTDNWREFLDEQIEKFGNEFEIEPVSLFEHQKINPIEELWQQ
jgi:hypothetical protein